MVVNVKKGTVGMADGWKVWDGEVDRGREIYGLWDLFGGCWSLVGAVG